MAESSTSMVIELPIGVLIGVCITLMAQAGARAIVDRIFSWDDTIDED